MKNARMEGSRVLRFIRREKTTPMFRFLVTALSVLLALVFTGVLILILGQNPLFAYKKMIMGAFGSLDKLSTTLIKAIPLMLGGLAVSVAFKMQLVNTGAEGQICMGAIASAGVALFCDFIPAPLVLPCMFLAGFLAGGLWAVIATLPKALMGVSEIIVTLMLNYVAIHFLDYFVYGPWKDPNGGNMPISAPFESYERLPKLLGFSVNAGLIIAIVAAVLLYIVFTKSSWGYQMKVIGYSAKSARYAGMSITRNIIVAMLISGGLAGLAGFAEVSGSMGVIQANVSKGYGYSAIIIAYLSKFNPYVVLLVATLFGGMMAGGYSMQVAGFPSQLVTIIQGAILLFVLGGEIFKNYKITFRKAQKGGVEK